MDSFIFIFFYLVKRITKSGWCESTRSCEMKSDFGFFILKLRSKLDNKKTPIFI
jgi:hypothetical protein